MDDQRPNDFGRIGQSNRDQTFHLRCYNTYVSVGILVEKEKKGRYTTVLLIFMLMIISYEYKY